MAAGVKAVGNLPHILPALLQSSPGLSKSQMEGLLAEFEALAASLPTGANVFTALAAKLHESAYPPKARGTTVQIWVIVGLHAV